MKKGVGVDWLGVLPSSEESFQKLPHESCTGRDLATGPHLAARKTEKCSHTSGQPYVQLKILLLRILQILWDDSPSVPQCDMVLWESGIGIQEIQQIFEYLYLTVSVSRRNWGFCQASFSEEESKGAEGTCQGEMRAIWFGIKAG